MCDQLVCKLEWASKLASFFESNSDGIFISRYLAASTKKLVALFSIYVGIKFFSH